MQVLGVDWGDRRIGLAVSDPEGRVAVGAGTLIVTSAGGALSALADAANSRGVEMIVIGLPVSLDGGHGPRAVKTERFARDLRARVMVPVVCWDERLTSAAAMRAIRETGGSDRSARGRTDEMAATILLQSWLDAQRTDRVAGPGRTHPPDDVTRKDG